MPVLDCIASKELAVHVKPGVRSKVSFILQGLGFPQLSNMRTLPVFFNMMTQGLLDAPTFSIYLNPDPASEPAGEIQFGGMNNARFLGSVNWTPVVEKL